MYLAPACFLWLMAGVALVEWPAMRDNNALQLMVNKPFWYFAAAAMGFCVNLLAYMVIQTASPLPLKVSLPPPPTPTPPCLPHCLHHWLGLAGLPTRHVDIWSLCGCTSMCRATAAASPVTLVGWHCFVTDASAVHIYCYHTTTT